MQQSFSQWMIAFFIPPLYFALQRRWGAFLVNGFFYVIAVFTVFLFGIGIIPWAFCVLHATLDLRNRAVADMTERGASILAAKMAEHLQARPQVKEDVAPQDGR